MGFRIENLSNFRTEGSIIGHELATAVRGQVLVNFLSAERWRIEIVLCAEALSSRKNHAHLKKSYLFSLTSSCNFAKTYSWLLVHHLIWRCT